MRTWVGRSDPRDEKGAVAILTALVMVALMLCAAIVVDLGMARDVRRQSQNGADAASLAGANALYPSTKVCNPVVAGGPPCIADATATVKSYALNNFQVSASDWSTCTAALPSGYVPSTGTSCISYNSATSPTIVRVVMPTRAVATAFGAFARKSSIPVGSSAQAQVGLVVTCSLCFLGGVDVDNADFSVSGGSVAVNGDITAGPNSVWTATVNGVVGTVNGGKFTPAPTVIPSFTDPLASLAMPSTTGLTAKTNPCGTGATHGPGLYSGSFTSLPNNPCNLQPGLYVVSGTWGMKNNDQLTGTGVTIYVTSPGGYLDFKNGDVNIKSPTPAQVAVSGGVAGYAIIYDRANTNNLGLQGNGGTSIDGAVYAAKSKLDFNGNSCFGFKGGPIVALGVIKANGNTSCVTITSAIDTDVVRTLLHLNK
jgi:hypothetical protein